MDLNSIRYGIWSTPKILLKCKFDKHFFITSSKFLTKKKKRSGQDRALWLASRHYLKIQGHVAHNSLSYRGLISAMHER